MKAWPVFTRFHIGPFVEGVLSLCFNDTASLLNKMAAMPIYGKNTEQKFSPEPRKP